ncbi:putative START-like domain superfamily protein [Plasmopara halstedii]
MSTKRFTVNPFDDLRLSVDDRTKLLAVAEELVHAKFAEYEEYINKRKWIDPVRWKKCSQAGAATTFMERKSVNPGSKMVAALMVGPLFGTLDDVMFGLVCPTLESMRIKASYLHDFSAAAVLATILEPTEDDPFRSVVVKWMEIDIPGASFGFVRNRDYVYLESTGILHLKNGERVGYHLLHSVSFAQTHERPGRIRGNMSLCGIFRQDGPDRTDCRGTSVIDPKGDIIPSMAMMRLVNATMAGVRYSYCGQMKKLAWLVEQRHAEVREVGAPIVKPLCVTCAKGVKSSRLRRSGKPNRTCKLCFGALCRSCKVSKKLSFTLPDLSLIQMKLSFCVRCLIEANRIDTLKAARHQFVFGNSTYHRAYGSISDSCRTSRTESIVKSGSTPTDSTDS